MDPILETVLRGSEWQRTRDALYAPGSPFQRGPFDDNPWQQAQGGVEPFVTEVMKGFPIPQRTFGDLLFRSVRAPAVTFQYRTFDGSTLTGATDLRRGPSAPFKAIRRGYDRASVTLERRGVVAVADRDELPQAEVAAGFIPDFAGRKAFEARMEGRKDIEINDRKPLIDAAGSYSNVTALAGGQEWDDATNGDSRAKIQTEAWGLANRNGVQPGDIGVALTHASLRAAQSDPTLIAALTAGGTGRPANLGSTITLDQLRDYWGVGEVVAGDFFYATEDPAAAFASAYGDIAVLYLMRRPIDDFDMRETSNDGFVDFTLDVAGLALEPVYKNVETDGIATSWLYPWEGWNTGAVINSNALAKITNTKA